MVRDCIASITIQVFRTSNAYRFHILSRQDFFSLYHNWLGSVWILLKGCTCLIYPILQASRKQKKDVDLNQLNGCVCGNGWSFPSLLMRNYFDLFSTSEPVEKSVPPSIRVVMERLWNWNLIFWKYTTRRCRHCCIPPIREYGNYFCWVAQKVCVVLFHRY